MTRYEATMHRILFPQTYQNLMNLEPMLAEIF
jgi:hypothetical protein